MTKLFNSAFRTTLAFFWTTFVSVPADAATASHVSQHDASCNPAHTLCTPSAVREAFEATEVVRKDKGNLKIPALVSKNLLVRAFALPNTDDNNNPDIIKAKFTLNRHGVGRWFTFVGGSDLLEKILVAGQYSASKIYQDIGYGAEFQCGADQVYWLAVFEKGPSVYLRKGIYDNLSPWLRHVYGAQAPKVKTSALDELKSRRFTEITGCPVDPNTGVFSPADHLADCLDCFQEAYHSLATKTCGNPNALTHDGNAQCPTDAALSQFGPKPSACQLRAYLYSASTFNEFNTGYGYTANDYNDPLSREYWTDNAKLSDLPNLELLRVRCGTGLGGPTASGILSNTPYVTEF